MLKDPLFQRFFWGFFSPKLSPEIYPFSEKSECAYGTDDHLSKGH